MNQPSAEKVLFCHFSNYFDAHLCTSILKEHAIPYFIKNEAFGTLLPNVISIEVWILMHDRNRVVKIFENIEAINAATAEQPGFDQEWEHLSADNRICIHCGSKNTRIFEEDKDYSILHKLFNFKKSTQVKWFCFHCRNKF